MVVGQQNLTAGPKALGFHTKCSSQTTISHPVLLSAQSLPHGWVSKPLMSVSVCSRCTRHEKCVVQRTQNIWHNWPQRFIKSHKPWGCWATVAMVCRTILLLRQIGIELQLTVYLAGEIHTNWRQDLIDNVKAKGLDLEFVYPQQVHDRSDSVGEDIQGTQPSDYFRDLAASYINNLRNEVVKQQADNCITLFRTELKKCITAMDLSTGIAMCKPSIMIRPESLIHPLKELSHKSNVTVESVAQAAEVLAYIYE